MATSYAKEGAKCPWWLIFTLGPAAALRAARHVNKVRINPGNYRSAHAAANEAEYQSMLQETERNQPPCSPNANGMGVRMAYRINHGSFSPRHGTLRRAPEDGSGSPEVCGDTCRRQGFENMVLSLKASSPGRWCRQPAQEVRR